ncbi:MAG: GNAT family N-acetyltransferase [Anaerolineales bacterium]|nr:MAG: GNAT family N-acetyltransferase [Anaerolineales bacterium]
MQTFEEMILNNWADRFQCSTSILQENGTTLIPEEKYANQNMIVLWHIGKHTFSLFDPSLIELLNNIKAQLPINTSLSGDDIQKGIGTNLITSHDVGLIHYLFPSNLPNLVTPHTFSVRALSLSDEEQLSALHSNCTPEEVDDGYVEIDHEIVFGCFHDNKLVSAASGYRMAGFMDIGVLTHSSFRRLGLGKVVVGALCEWAVSQNIIAQYRCNIGNTNSLGIAKSLNFRYYFSSESLIMS